MSRIGRCVLWTAALLALFSCTAKKEAVRPPPPPPARVEVVQLQMTADREFVGVRFRMVGGGPSDLDAAEVYLVDESTGEKYPVVRLERIGRLAEFSVPGEEGTHYVIFRNRDNKLKVGKRVTIVVGNMRQEQLPIKP